MNSHDIFHYILHYPIKEPYIPLSYIPFYTLYNSNCVSWKNHIIPSLSDETHHCWSPPWPKFRTCRTTSFWVMPPAWWRCGWGNHISHCHISHSIPYIIPIVFHERTILSHHYPMKPTIAEVRLGRNSGRAARRRSGWCHRPGDAAGEGWSAEALCGRCRRGWMGYTMVSSPSKYGLIMFNHHQSVV